MATIPSPPRSFGADAEPDYPTGDGRPVAETPIHYRNLKCAVETLERYLAHDPQAYSWGNMFVYYEKGNKRKHVSPDVFVALGVPKDKPRNAYFTWLEGHGLDLVIELTSPSTKDEDLEVKMSIYQNEIVVPEYFLFDPRDEYLEPPLQGFRLREGTYSPIEMAHGRLPSEVLGLHLERDGEWLRFYNPASGCWLPTPEEVLAEEQAKRERAEAQCKQAEAERTRISAELQASVAEAERLRQELADWRRRFGGESDGGPPDGPI
ncbi:MAG TPA: Uma2 family endonuclease [Pirellulales bacterium]